MPDQLAEGGPALHAVADGGSGTPEARVVLVHGFTQTLAAWEPVAARLGARWRVLRVDLPGHGGSAAGRAAYVGYSLGGRLCLRLALDRPDLVRALVLLSASPGIADPAARAERVAADE